MMYEAPSKNALRCEECEYRGRYTFCDFSTAARKELHSIGMHVAFPSEPSCIRRETVPNR
jgi:hypothetical protein